MYHNKESIDANNKNAYLKSGLKDEIYFVDTLAPIIGEDIRINPEKYNNPMVIDCHWYDQFGTRFDADIKTEKTPFFTAQHRHNIDPQFAVTFGLKDMFNYSYWHKADYVIFRICWETLKYTWRDKTIAVQPLHGVWFTGMQKLRELATIQRFHPHLERLENQSHGAARQTEIAQITEVAQRIINNDVANLSINDCIHKPNASGARNDKGNFVYDVREFTRLWINTPWVLGWLGRIPRALIAAPSQPTSRLYFSWNNRNNRNRFITNKLMTTTFDTRHPHPNRLWL